MTRYKVRHRTTFAYTETVSVSRHVMHLIPRSFGRQRCLSSTVEVLPTPSHMGVTSDYFGNQVNHVTVQQPHEELVVEARSHIEVAAPDAIDLQASPPWEELASRVAHASSDPNALNVTEYTQQSPHTVASDAVQQFALDVFSPNRPILEATMALTERIYTEFEYKGGLSDIYTPVDTVLQMRKGVCQDFAHLQLACMHSLGLSARYISGYLLTYPPEGEEKMVGADASHAWLSVWAGDMGWVDFDPTNNLIPRDEHITVGWGRDYGDVSPINGFILGGGAHELSVAVDVIRED